MPQSTDWFSWLLSCCPAPRIVGAAATLTDGQSTIDRQSAPTLHCVRDVSPLLCPLFHRWQSLTPELDHFAIWHLAFALVLILGGPRSGFQEYFQGKLGGNQSFGVAKCSTKNRWLMSPRSFWLQRLSHRLSWRLAAWAPPITLNQPVLIWVCHSVCRRDFLPVMEGLCDVLLPRFCNERSNGDQCYVTRRCFGPRIFDQPPHVKRYHRIRRDWIYSY